MRFRSRLEAAEKKAAPQKHTSIVITTDDTEFTYDGKTYPIDQLEQVAKRGNFYPGIPPVIEIDLSDSI